MTSHLEINNNKLFTESVLWYLPPSFNKKKKKKKKKDNRDPVCQIYFDYF